MLNPNTAGPSLRHPKALKAWILIIGTPSRSAPIRRLRSRAKPAKESRAYHPLLLLQGSVHDPGRRAPRPRPRGCLRRKLTAAAVLPRALFSSRKVHGPHAPQLPPCLPRYRLIPAVSLLPGVGCALAKTSPQPRPVEAVSGEIALGGCVTVEAPGYGIGFLGIIFPALVSFSDF